ncbi:hypothetical protein PVAP13_4KG089000 [Panicum virgatum]|uniref:Uncharacterized protein n=1 Tax=Panicum virgatum TaxID=38727 RepID=A0A8T0TL81_PANVG|nr:hypothetical protein PVAP13_4KG089000 [Panicum virgatum]
MRLRLQTAHAHPFVAATAGVSHRLPLPFSSDLAAAALGSSLPRCRRPPFSTSPIAARTSGPSRAASTRPRGRAPADGTGSRGRQAAAPDPRGMCYCCSCSLGLRVHGVGAPRSGSEVCGEERKEGASSVGARMRDALASTARAAPSPLLLNNSLFSPTILTRPTLVGSGRRPATGWVLPAPHPSLGLRHGGG